MEPPPFCEETQLVHFDDPERFAGVRRAHVMILPQGRRRFLVTNANQNLATVCGLDVDVGGLMFPWR
jgi:hypothetical protein